MVVEVDLERLEIVGWKQSANRSKKPSWHRDVVAITTGQLHSTKPELRFCAGLNPACGVSEIHDRGDL